jgi:hypothetical protein
MGILRNYSAVAPQAPNVSNVSTVSNGSTISYVPYGSYYPYGEEMSAPEPSFIGGVIIGTQPEIPVRFTSKNRRRFLCLLVFGICSIIALISCLIYAFIVLF